MAVGTPADENSHPTGLVAAWRGGKRAPSSHGRSAARDLDQSLEDGSPFSDPVLPLVPLGARLVLYEAARIPAMRVAGVISGRAR
jgi:hypothetical protein